ncbi:MAG: hypothetical protein QOD39_1104 [Mycobacterium sp.]|jgi:hypothetical protein|nr:hypothetical protein [Mycobacterium sp.]
MIHPDGAVWESANDRFEEYYATLETLEERLGAFM